MTFTIYYNKNCAKCRLTEMILSNNTSNKITMLPITDKKRAEFQRLGFQSAPVVFAYKDGKEIDHWNDFNSKMLEKYK